VDNQKPELRPFLIIPHLIPQPTWGGDYIATTKSITYPETNSLALGQSYELSGDSLLSPKLSTKYNPPVLLSQSDSKPLLLGDSTKHFPISKLTDSNPPAVLGKKATNQFGKKLNLLIKLTQAKGNSFQLHVAKPVDNWQPKPESWFFLSPGLVTLGIKPDIDWNVFREVLNQIDKKAHYLSDQIIQNKLTRNQALASLNEYIKTFNPHQFVNRLQVARHQAIDLSSGGLHHSWEHDPKLLPQGNLVYELQLNVSDTASTIRAFDQGKLDANHKPRQLHLKDYFTHLNRDPEFNQPKNHMTKTKILKQTATYTIRQLLSTPHYQLQSLSFNQPIKNRFTTTTDSFHHLFAQKGNFLLTTEHFRLHLTKGYSVFIPACLGQYQLTPIASRSVTILKSYL